MAKAFVAHADALYSLGVEWYLKTILVMEPVALSVERHLGNGHPIQRLLRPFLRDAVASAASAREWFAGPDGFWDRFASISTTGLYAMTQHYYQDWSLEDCAPKTILRERVGSETLPRIYPFREDASLLWTTIESFVTKFVDMHFTVDPSTGIIKAAKTSPAHLISRILHL